MMRNLTGADLPQWIAKALADDLPGLHSFVKDDMHPARRWVS